MPSLLILPILEMKFMLISTSLCLISPCDAMSIIRSNYHEIKTKQALEAFIGLLNETDCRAAEPYLASAVMQKAQYAFLPTDKLKYFNRGKKRLEDFIHRHPENLEARYIRLLVQSEIPWFLSYKDQIKPDAEFILAHLKEADLPTDFKNLIKTNVDKIVKENP